MISSGGKKKKVLTVTHHKKVTELQNESVSDKADTARSVFIVKRDVSYVFPSQLSKSSVICLFNAVS